MQSNLIINLTEKEKITLEDYNSLSNVSEYVLYSDNILEGITLLNDLNIDSLYLQLYGVVYEPIDQPIYVFIDDDKAFYGIKICGAYNKWNLPRGVAQIINYVDLPDYVFYSIKNKKVILAGENTESAPVGNAKWQREGRKLAAARFAVPFIYQTFYSGRDESQDKIRESDSLQVYNQLVYTVRYKTPSLIAFFENDFENSKTRERTDRKFGGRELMGLYIKLSLICDANPDNTFMCIKKKIEKDFFMHMLSYIKEVKYSDIGKPNAKTRLMLDFPPTDPSLYNEIVNKTETFIDNLVDYLYEIDDEKIVSYLRSSFLCNFDDNEFKNWNSYNKKKNICSIISYLKNNNSTPKSYIIRHSKIGFCDTYLCKQFLKTKFPNETCVIDKLLDNVKYPVSILMPLRIHKFSNHTLTLSPDPESGEIVAYAELFSLDLFKKKKRPIIGYCIVDTPERFSIKEKKGTKLFKAIAEYVDLLVVNNSQLIYDLSDPNIYSDYFPKNLSEIMALSTTEEMSVVSVFLSLSTIMSDWKLCFIHTHHSSWQMLEIFSRGNVVKEKIDRVSTKVDLIMQSNNSFMIAEGKNTYQDLIRDPKIKKSMEWGGCQIDKLFGQNNIKFDSFIYNLSVDITCGLQHCLSRDISLINGDINSGKFNDIAYHENFVVIIVYVYDNKTKYELVFSPKFPIEIRSNLEKSFK